MTPLAVHLSDDQADRIDAIAKHSHASAAQVVQEAVTRYLDDDAEFRAAVKVGMDEADRGETEDFDVVAAEIRAYMAIRIAAADQ